MKQSSAALPDYMSSQVAGARRFYLHTEERTESGFTVVSGGWERCAADYQIQRRGFPYLTLEFVVNGRGELRIGGKTHALTRGVVFAYGPRVAHTISTDSENHLSKYFLNLTGRGAAKLFASAGLPLGSCHAVASIDELQAAYEQLLFFASRGGANSARMAALHAQILFLLLSEVRLPVARRGNHALQTFLRCRKYFEKTFLTIHTAEEGAAACYVAPEYLSRLFVRYAGVPPYQFLMRLKMHYAAGLLDEKHLLVREAADAIRMDPFHFSRCFKRVHGLSPQAFLRTRQGAEIEVET